MGDDEHRHHDWEDLGRKVGVFYLRCKVPGCGEWVATA